MIWAFAIHWTSCVTIRSDFTLLCRYIRLPRFYFPLFPHTEAHVWCNLVVLSCMIWSSGFSWSLLYDIYLRAMHTTILSIRGVTIPIYLVSSTTDSIRRLVVLFKSVTIPTSDPKSEFLCQSSLSCAEPTDPLNSPRTPGISPTPSQPRIILIAIARVLLPSIWRRSYTNNRPNVLVTASLLKSSQMFHSNVTSCFAKNSREAMNEFIISKLGGIQVVPDQERYWWHSQACVIIYGISLVCLQIDTLS